MENAKKKKKQFPSVTPIKLASLPTPTSQLKKNIYNPPYNSSWFETENKVSLDKYIKRLFSIAKIHLKSNVVPDTIKGILVPHAGIRYSGLCSAAAYSQIIGRKQPIKRIILLCTNHEGSIAASSGFISTTYTNVSSNTDTNVNINIDTKTINYLKPYLQFDDKRFQEEHSFFNQLPFIENIILESGLGNTKPSKVLLLPFLISNSLNLLDEKVRSNIKKIILTLIELLKNQDTILICTSDFSHINGHFEYKIKSNIHQNIRKKDNEILQFLYDGINGINNRNQKIDDILFIQNAPSCGTMAIYFFAKMLNIFSGGIDYSSSSSSSSSSNDSKSPNIYKLMQLKDQNFEKKKCK
jgi:AmmeMemoRadiSam system protein B